MDEEQELAGQDPREDEDQVHQEEYGPVRTSMGPLATTQLERKKMELKLELDKMELEK